MSAPRDAVTLFRTVLANPADDLPRLVFADWLDDTGEPHNVAWAEYLRLHSSDQRYDPVRVAVSSNSVRARLTLPAAVFVRHQELLLKLLPPKNVQVQLARFRPAFALAELTPMSIAFENMVLPLSLRENTLTLATPTPTDVELVWRLNFVLNRDILLVGTPHPDIEDCIARTYGDLSQYESVDTPFFEFPDMLLHTD